jgi:hypothetical protein
MSPVKLPQLPQDTWTHNQLVFSNLSLPPLSQCNVMTKKEGCRHQLERSTTSDNHIAALQARLAQDPASVAIVRQLCDSMTMHMASKLANNKQAAQPMMMMMGEANAYKLQEFYVCYIN